MKTKVKWNKVTWYSKLIALVIFITFPFIGFYLGVRYGEVLAKIYITSQIAAKQGVFLPSADQMMYQWADAKVRLAINQWWGVGTSEILRDPVNKSMFYFVSHQIKPSDAETIIAYDISVDKQFQIYGEPDVRPGADGISFLYRQSLDVNHWFKLVGVRDDKLVFVAAKTDEDLGPCGSYWMYGGLNYIDLTHPGSGAQPFNLSSDELGSITQEAQNCLDTLNASAD